MSNEPADSLDVAALALGRCRGWPEEMRVLIARYPRERWQGHRNLGAMARFWLSRHAMFRELAGSIRQLSGDFAAGQMPAMEFARQFVPRLQFMLNQLDVHHQIEDFHYFPLFRAADARLACGFDVLEGDHHHIHGDMERIAEKANVMLRALQAGSEKLRKVADDYADASGALLSGLLRHLDDEEDLIVPLILDRGEEALGVAHHG